MSEQDWQAAVLIELGVPPAGLMLPGSEPVVRAEQRPPPAPRPAVESQPAYQAAPVSVERTVAENPPEKTERPPETPPETFARPAPETTPGPPPQTINERPPETISDALPDAQLPQDVWDRASQPWDQGAQALWSQTPQAPENAAPADTPDGSWEGTASGAWQHEPEDRSPPRPARGRHTPGRESPRAPAPRPSQPQAPGGGPIGAHDLVRKSAHGDPFARRLSRGMRRVVGASGAAEVRRTADVEMILGRQLPSRRQIAVTSIRGGAGKTTVAGLTATVIAQYRQDRVLAVDADSGLGSLPLRLGVAPQWSVHDLAKAQPRTFEDVSQYLSRTADGLWVLSGTAGGRIGGELDLATYQAAVGVLTRYFAAIVVDCGAGLLPELQRGVLADSHAQVMVTPGTVDGAISAQGALDWQRRNGFEHLMPRTVIAFVTHTPHVDADLSRAAQMMGGMPVVPLPYDRHLATGTAVESARIGADTRAAAIRVAVEAFARAVSV